MTSEEFLELCLTEKGSYIDFPFGDDTTIVKVKNKIFAQIFTLKGIESLTLNCTLDMGQIYRGLFPDVVVRGYHCPPVQQPYFNTMPIDKIPDSALVDMLDHSYSTVISKLSKYLQRELLNDN